jgi:hypothetical protein
MAAPATSGLHMLAMRPCIPACKQMFGSTSVVFVFGRALGTRTGFGTRNGLPVVLESHQHIHLFHQT